MKYNEFVAWTLQGNIDLFYESMRWNGWKSDAGNVRLDQGVLIYPFLRVRSAR